MDDRSRADGCSCVRKDTENAKKATNDLKVQMEELAKRSNEFAGAITRAFENAAIRGEKLSVVIGKLGLSLSNIALKAAQKPIEKFLSSMISNVLTGKTAFAKGGVVTPFAKGGVISSPVAFPLGGGIGIAGEAGAEAILPLSRGPGGKLGVAANGSGGVTVNFSVNTSDAQSFLQSEAQVAAMLNRVVSRGKRNL